MIYLDAGTTYSKIVEIDSNDFLKEHEQYLKKQEHNKNYYILPSALIKNSNIKIQKCW